MEAEKNVERSGNGGGHKPQTKEEAVDDEEGIHFPQAEEKSYERNKTPTFKLEDESIELEEGEESNSAISLSMSERDGKKDVKEMKEFKPPESSTDSKEVASIESKPFSHIKDGVQKEKDNLQNLSSGDLLSQPGSAQIKISQHKKAIVPAHEVIENKKESSSQDTGSSEPSKNSQTTSADELVDIKETTYEDTLLEKSQQSEGGELKVNIEEQISNQEGEINEEVGKSTLEEGTSTKHKSDINYIELEKEKITNTETKSIENENVIDNDKSGSMQGNEGLNLGDETHKTEPMKPISQVEKPSGKIEKKDSIRVTQEKKRQIASISSETAKQLPHKTDTTSKTRMKSYLRTDTDNKPTKSKSMELYKADKEINEKKVKQKQIKDTATPLATSSHRLKKPGMKDTLENSKQKSASTGALNKSIESKQKQCESQFLTTQEKSVKSKDFNTTKDASSRSPAKSQSIKNSCEKVIPKSAQSSVDINEKPVHRVFQGTVSRAAKCDEKVQRSTMEARKNQERMNKVTAEITATTEAAIKEQFKQLESKSSVQNKPASPKQVTKSPTKKQIQQRQQKPAQQKLQDQKQLLQKQPSPQKQKTARSPTRKQQEQKQLQQKLQPLRQQQKHQQIQKELVQPKITSQIQATNLSKPEMEQIEIKETSQIQQEVCQQEHQQKEKQEQKQVPEQKTKQLANKVQQKILIPKQKPQVKQIKQQDEQGRQQLNKEMLQEQKLAYLKESKDQEQKEQCEKPMIQQDKDTIEQHNLQQKQREQEEAMAKQLEDQEQEKQHQKEDQPDQMEQKEQSKQQLQQQSEDGDEDGGVCGMQGRTCPIYFGVKSYLHHFYDSTPIKSSPLYEEYIEEDDFEYAVDPVKNQGCRRCCRGFWFRAGLWGGINLILVGVITLLVGYLTPQREMVVGHHNNLEILDRSAIAFNRRLELCRLAGLAVFCCGGLVLLLTLLLSSFLHVGSHNNNNSQCCGDNMYYRYVSTSLVEPFIATPNQTVPVSTGIKIPITEQIKSVQPTLWPDIATVKDGTLVPHLP